MEQLINFNILKDTHHPEQQKASCLVIAILENKKLSNTGKQLDKASAGWISAVLKKADIKGNVGETLLLHNVPNTKADRILLIGSGNNTQYKTVCASISSALLQSHSTEVVLYLSDFLPTSELYWPIRDTIESIHQSVYRFDGFKTEKLLPPATLRSIAFALSDLSPSTQKSAKTAIEQGLALSQAIIHTKNLGNMPPNLCTPSYLAQYAKKLAEKHTNIKVTVLEEKEMKTLKMGLLLSVTKGSKEPAKFIIAEYTGEKAKSKPIVLVGKGITFDTGGNSLKSSAGMVGMKYDMCGAATVLGVIEFASKMKLPVHIVGLIPTCENMPGGDATRPDDIVKSMSGLTVEILNTDAEGRLILADALTYAQRYNPKVVIDIATLTGACIAALGYHASGLLSNHSALAHDLLAAGIQTGDRAWELPLWPEYEKILSSKFADIANANMGSTSNAGTITAACFLAKFTQKYHWAHLDVAGTACYFSGEQQGATGRPVSLLAQYILNQLK